MPQGRSELVPGLLQTDEYARAVITAVRPGLSPDETERRVEARMRAVTWNS
ncbi:Scr1 family TA system antitoxin-like transcriptional regulator [Sphaerisporangium album]|uniref:Scr1 family TA system antitoxin-like transcriptional regulator n=1 Tax=Sphaerisporangium album TaxID=509200 RepID=UPI001FEBB1B0|nr:Scr1 family TA system antitoxin-like transcriptional regulator [Sphaerisporangium album]